MKFWQFVEKSYHLPLINHKKVTMYKMPNATWRTVCNDVLKSHQRRLITAEKIFRNLDKITFTFGQVFLFLMIFAEGLAISFSREKV